MFESCCFLTTMTIWVVSNHSQQPGVSPHSWSWWSGNSNFQTLLSSPTSFVITISPYIHFLAVPLIRLYSLQLEWLDTIKMVMMVQNNRIQT